MIIRQTKTRYTPVPRPHAPSAALSTPAFVRRTPVFPPPRLPRIFPPVFFFSNGAESFRSCRRITGNTISSASSTGARTRDIYFPYPGFFFSLATFAFSRRFPSRCRLPPRRHLFALDFSIFKYRSHRNRVVLISLGRLPLRSFVIPIPEVILPNFDSRRGSIVEHARPSCVIR